MIRRLKKKKRWREEYVIVKLRMYFVTNGNNAKEEGICVGRVVNGNVCLVHHILQ